MPGICVEPLVNMNVTTYRVFPCCNSYFDYNTEFLKTIGVPTVIVGKAWNSPAWVAFRQRIRSGDYSMCTHCPRYIHQSDAFKEPDVIGQLYGQEVYDFVTGKRDDIESPYNVILSFDSTCNLVCPTCRNKPIKTSPSLLKRWLDSSMPYIKNAKHVIIAGDGEVCMSKYYQQVLDEIPIETKVTLMTNGTLLNEHFWNAHPGLLDHIYSVNVSCDGTTADIFEQTRVNGKFDIFMDNMAKMVELKHQYGFRTSLRYTISTRNIDDYRNVPQFARQLEFDILDMERAIKWERYNDGELYYSKNIITDESMIAAIDAELDSIILEYNAPYNERLAGTSTVATDILTTGTTALGSTT